MTNRIANFILIVGSLIISLPLVESSIRIFAPQPMSGTIFEYAPRGYRISKSNGTALFSVGDSKGIYHFIPPHLRGIKKPPAGAERILVLGDSFTFGIGLSENDTYVARLQKKIDSAFEPDRFALLNAGIGGSGTTEQLAFLEDFGDDIGPRRVFIFVSINDFNRAQRSSLYRLRSIDSLELDEGTVPTSRLNTLITSEVYNFAVQHVHIAQLIRRAILSAILPSISDAGSAAAEETKPTSTASSDQQRLVRALFRRMKAWCDSRGVKLAVINNGWRSYDWLAALLSAEGIIFFDAAPQVQAVVGSPAHVIQGDLHPNAKGAAVTAEAVWPFVKNLLKDDNLIQR